jgi:hypothetical protein
VFLPSRSDTDFLPKNRTLISQWLAMIDNGIQQRQAGRKTQPDASWLFVLADKAPDASDIVFSHVHTILNARALAAIAYPQLAKVLLGSRRMRRAIVCAWIQRGCGYAPASLATSSLATSSMDDASLALLVMTAAGDRDAMRAVMRSYRYGCLEHPRTHSWTPRTARWRRQ